MSGDRVQITAYALEQDEKPVYAVHISEKPQFMLDEEFKYHLLECGKNVIEGICQRIYPNNKSAQEMCLEYIKSRLGTF